MSGMSGGVLPNKKFSNRTFSNKKFSNKNFFGIFFCNFLLEAFYRNALNGTYPVLDKAGHRTAPVNRTGPKTGQSEGTCDARRRGPGVQLRYIEGGGDVWIAQLPPSPCLATVDGALQHAPPPPSNPPPRRPVLPIRRRTHHLEQSLAPQGTGLPSHQRHNKRLFSDIVVGTFPGHNRCSLRKCAEGSFYCPNI